VVKEFMNQKRRVVIFIGVLTITTISISSAYALEISNPLAKVFDEWQEQLGSLDKYISSTVSHKLNDLSKSIRGDLQAAVNESVGALGLPDSTEVREKVEEIAISNDSDRQITRGAASSTLGQDGQQRTKTQVQKTEDSIEQVQSDGEVAQGEVVTQNVMKRIAKQNTQTAAILGAMRTDGLKLQQSQELANLNLTNISRSLDGQNQARQKESVGQGFSNLRTASQARLF
jgi:hypothetical protein